MPAISERVTIENGALKMIFKGSGCFQFPEAVVTSIVKESLAQPNAVHYKFSLFYRSSNCREHL